MHYRPLDRLRAIHTRLEHELHAERTRPLPDSTRLARLKKFKLAVKDRIAARGAQPAYA